MLKTPEILAENIYFGEAPRWHDGRLWFSDFHAHAVKSVSMAGDLRVECEIQDRPSGLGWLPDGSLLIVSMQRRQVLRRALDGALSLYADLSSVAAFHCNDMVVDAHGHAFVGNFGFDLDAAIRARGVPDVIADHPTAALARIDPDGSAHVAADGLHFPNGMVITPDGATLIIGETLGGALTAFDLAPDGNLSNRRVWASIWPRVPDGIALNADGAIWIANPVAPECALIAEAGVVLEVIDTGMPCFACMLGGADGRTLFMLTAPSSDAKICAQAALGQLLAVTVDTPRAGLP